MSLYNSQVKTHVVESHYHDNTRTEIRLEPRVWYSNWRLTNIGATMTAITNKYWALSSGCASGIRNMYLYDGNVLLDQKQECHQHVGFNSLRQSNEYNQDVDKELLQSHLGYQVLEDKITGSHSPSNAITDDATTTSTGWINLRNVFGFLKAVSQVSGKTFPNLRIIIEWRQDFINLMQDSNGLTALTYLKPQLIVDENLNPKSTQSGSVPFWSTEIDRLEVPAVAINTPYSLKTRVNGFNNKFVRRMAIANVNSTLGNAVASANKLKIDTSYPEKLETLQVIVNNNQIFEFKGIDNQAKKLAMLSDHWGDLNVPLGADWYAMRATTSLFTASSVPVDLVGKLSYYGFSVNDKLSNFEVEYNKTPHANRAACQLLFMGEVLKELTISDKGYVIANV